MGKAEDKAKLIAEARVNVMRGRDAKGILAQPVIQDFFAHELAETFQEFLNTSGDKVGQLVSCSLRGQLILALAKHLETVAALADASEVSLRNTEREN